MPHVTYLPTKHGRGLRLHGDHDAEEKQPEEQILEASNHRDERKVTTLRELLQRPDLETAPMTSSLSRECHEYSISMRKDQRDCLETYLHRKSKALT